MNEYFENEKNILKTNKILKKNYFSISIQRKWFLFIIILAASHFLEFFPSLIYSNEYRYINYLYKSIGFSVLIFKYNLNMMIFNLIEFNNFYSFFQILRIKNIFFHFISFIFLNFFKYFLYIEYSKEMFQDFFIIAFAYLVYQNFNKINTNTFRIHKANLIQDLEDIYILIKNDFSIENIINGSKFFFTSLEDIFKNLNSDLNYLKGIFNKNYFFENFKNDYLGKNLNKKFMFLGIKKYEETSSKYYYYQLLGRVTSKGYEFYLKDISKVYEIQKKNAENKFKSIILSKIAHEFKNPLISINELADQIIDSENKINNKRFSQTAHLKDNLTFFTRKFTLLENKNKYTKDDNLMQIKSLSEYLQFLVKDLDIFSHISLVPKQISVKNINVQIKDLIIFLNEISKGLLRKFGKENLIFSISIINEFEYFYTDEIKLKQILINLLSNAIKYTTIGNILLKIFINKETNEVVFNMIDTGVGISKENQMKLFKPFINKDIYSSGLGLYIVKELLQILGSEIKYESEIDKGTKFYFSLPYIKPEIMETGISKVLNLKETKCETEYQLDISPLIIPRTSKSNVINQRKKSIIENMFESKKSFFEYQSNDMTSNISKETVKLSNLVLSHPFKKNLRKKANLSKLVRNVESEYSFSSEEDNENSLSNIKINFNCPDTLNIIVVDDECLSRQSAVRLIKTQCFNKNKKAQIIEANDGIECLYITYLLLSKGMKISCILSDETMNYMNGSQCAKNIRKITNMKSMPDIPFYLITAYEDSHTLKSLGCQEINFIFSKPLLKSVIEEVLNSIK